MNFPQRKLADLAVFALVLVCALTVVGKTAAGKDETPGEYKVKAAYLYNFTKFVKWPDEVLGPDEGFINVCIMGEDPFGADLDAVKWKSVQEKVVRVMVLEDLEDPAEACHMLFLKAGKKDTSRILARIGDRPVLTVSDTEGFLSMGGMINMYLVEGRIRFEINSQAAARSGLSISSSLMRLSVPAGK